MYLAVREIYQLGDIGLVNSLNYARKKIPNQEKTALWKIAVPGPTYAGCSFDIVLSNKDESGSYRPAICM